jgi:hypothetical protein
MRVLEERILIKTEIRRAELKKDETEPGSAINSNKRVNILK